MTRGAPPDVSPSMAMFPGTTWCTEVAAALSSLGQGSHFLGNLCPSLTIPSPASFVTMALALTFSWVSSFSLSTFWVASISCKYEVPGVLYKYQTVTDVFVDPMEEANLEVPLGLQVHHPPRAFELDLIKGPFQPCGKGGDFLIITLGDLIEVLYENIKGGHCAKNNGQCLQDMGNASSGPLVPDHICCCPL